MLEWIKKKLNITDTSRDEDIKDYIEDITAQVLKYCNIKELPSDLNYFVKRKVLTIMQYERDKDNQLLQGEVKSITEGDTTIQYSLDQNLNFSGIYKLTDVDKDTLRGYRCLK